VVEGSDGPTHFGHMYEYALFVQSNESSPILNVADTSSASGHSRRSFRGAILTAGCLPMARMSEEGEATPRPSLRSHLSQTLEAGSATEALLGSGKKLDRGTVGCVRTLQCCGGQCKV